MPRGDVHANPGQRRGAADASSSSAADASRRARQGGHEPEVLRGRRGRRGSHHLARLRRALRPITPVVPGGRRPRRLGARCSSHHAGVVAGRRLLRHPPPAPGQGATSRGDRVRGNASARVSTRSSRRRLVHTAVCRVLLLHARISRCDPGRCFHSFPSRRTRASSPLSGRPSRRRSGLARLRDVIHSPSIEPVHVVLHLARHRRRAHQTPPAPSARRVQSRRHLSLMLSNRRLIVMAC